jgi:hypothetical protein
MNATAAFFPFTVTLVPSRLVGNTPFTISVAVFHWRVSGARLVPKIDTQEPVVMGPGVKPAALTTAEMAGGVSAPMAIVAVTVGLGEIPLALNVMTQEWLPGVAPEDLIDAVTVAGVDPAAGDNVSHPQSAPSEAVNIRPEFGLVLLMEMFCAAGNGPPMV